MPVGRVSQNSKRRGRDDSRRPSRARRGTARPAGATRSRPRSGGTGGAFKLSSTPRAAVLALVVCAMALSVAVPMRNYWEQQSQLAAEQERREQVQQQLQQLQQRREELNDPAHVEAEARARLGYVRPGETPYMVHPSPPPEQQSTGDEAVDDAPWYERLWTSLRGGNES